MPPMSLVARALSTRPVAGTTGSHSSSGCSVFSGRYVLLLLLKGRPCRDKSSGSMCADVFHPVDDGKYLVTLSCAPHVLSKIDLAALILGLRRHRAYFVSHSSPFHMSGMKGLTAALLHFQGGGEACRVRRSVLT